MPSVYLTTIHSLYTLGNTRKGHVSYSAAVEELKLLTS